MALQLVKVRGWTCMGYVEEKAEEACILLSMAAGENDEEEEEEVLIIAKWCFILVFYPAGIAPDAEFMRRSPPPATPPPPPPTPSAPPPPPADLYEHITPWQQLTFSFVIPIVRYGTYKPLQQEDLLPVPVQDRAARVTARLEKEWAVELQTQQRPSLNRALYRTHNRAFYVSGVLLFIEYALMLAKPVVLRYLLSWLKGDVATEAEVGSTKHWWYGFGVALGLAGLNFIQTMVHHRAFMLTIRTGWRLRTSVQGLLYKKVLTLDSQWQSSASTGQIVSTLANDTQRYEECAPSLHFLWVAPLMAFAGLGLLIMYVGIWPAAAGCVVTVGIIPLQVWCGRRVGHARQVTAERTDRRVKLFSEVLSGIQTVKAFVWEAPFRASISAARALERESLGWAAEMRAITMGIFFVAPTLAASVTFLTLWGLGNRLELPTVFAVMTLLQTLRECARWIPRSIEQVSEAQVATRRVQFLLELPVVGQGRKKRVNEDRLKAKECVVKVENVVEIHDSDFSWTGEQKQEHEGDRNDDRTSPPTRNVSHLRHVSLVIKPGELLIVAGPVGSGKSTLLDVILGEVACVRGPGVKLWEGTRMAYCSQQSWIEVGTVRDNVTFGAALFSQQPTAMTTGTPTTNITTSTSRSGGRSGSRSSSRSGNCGSTSILKPVLDTKRYMCALKACALNHDLRNLASGDLTEIGELGINLSGGQRARVALARAVYADADLYLLDDVLSAVDAQVSKHLFHDCIRGLLLKEKKAVVLVTHQIQYLPYATRVCLLDKHGEMIAPCAPWEELRAMVPDWKGLVQERVGGVAVVVEGKGKCAQKGDQEERIEGERDREGRQEKSMGILGIKDASDAPTVFESKGHASASYMVAEDRVQGHVHGDTYVNYLRSGGIGAGMGIMLLLLISQGVQTLADFWLKIWAASQDARAARDSAYYYPVTYAILVAVCVVLGLLRADLFFRFALRASSSLHDQALEAVLAAPLAFFHSNQRGRILNKFAKDLDSADDLLPYTLFDFLQSAGLCVAAVVVGCIAVPYLLLIVAPLLYFFRKYRREFVKSAREVKRLDAITRSPLYADVSSSLQGGKVIRAFRAEAAMERRFLWRLDENGKCTFLFIVLSRYLGFRLDILCAWFLTVLCLMAVALHASLDPGMLGLSLTYALVLSGAFQWTVRQSAQAETFFTSVERLDHCTRLPSELDEDEQFGVVPVSDKDNKIFGQLSPSWPQRGEIFVKNLHVRYREDLPLVLSEINFVFRAGQKVGIVGRTGSGKSSFLAALLRLNQIVGGDIVLDGVSLPSLPRADARRSVAWIPQQPDLFAGTLRFNLDPFFNHGDTELHAALESVHLSFPLDMPVAEGGSNLSVGTRQLLSLARAVLLRRKVLLMDEATASVSFIEDKRIQATLRTAPCFRDCTMVTIAHRIESVIEADLILVFADGRCVEQGTPQVLLSTEGSLFAEMVREAQSGTMHGDLAKEKRMKK